jgi:hypothetical protein
MPKPASWPRTPPGPRSPYPGRGPPDTLISVTSLTIDLRYLGKTETAQITDGNLRGSRHSCRRLSYRAADLAEDQQEPSQEPT